MMTKQADRQYQDFFVRPFADTRQWLNKVTSSRYTDDHSLGQLFADCFSPHNDIRFAPDDISTLRPQRGDPSRLIRKNNLTAFFQNSFLKEPCAHKDTPIYESPNIEEDEADLGPATTFDYFWKCVTAIPFAPTAVDNPTLGENRVTFLIGEVGMGKTFLVSRLVQKVHCNQVDDDGFFVLPVYVCFENYLASFNDAKSAPEFVQLFLGKLSDLISKELLKHDKATFDAIPAPKLQGNPTTHQISAAISEYIRQLASVGQKKYRILLILDNLDVLHYQNSRYLFFPEHYNEHRRLIEQKLTALVYSFVDPNLMGDSGLCVLIVARHNVARDCRLLNHPALPRHNEIDDHVVFQIGRIDPLDVISSRLKLFEHAIDVCHKDSSALGDLSFRDQLGALRAATTNSIGSHNLSDGLRRISDLSHHGLRSLVDFLGKMRLNPVSQEEVFQRLFSHSPWILERLYIANMHQRFSQSQGHFPNMFLVDGTVNEDKVQGIQHVHTYWLKYLILKRIGLSERRGVSVQALIEEFCGALHYPTDIVRLCIGSLAMVNESRCIEIIGAAKEDSKENLVRLTKRGQLLAGHSNNLPKQLPYCFQFSYLQLVIDDHLLSLPRPFANRIAVEGSLSYAIDPLPKYQHRMVTDLERKLPATLTFVRVLESSWNAECRFNSALAAASSQLGPDFSRIYSELKGVVKAIASKAGINSAERLAIIDNLTEDKSFDDFFVEYYDNPIPVGN